MARNYLSISELEKLASEFIYSDIFYKSKTLEEVGKKFLQNLNNGKSIEKLEDVVTFLDKNHIHKKEFNSLNEAYEFIATNFLWVKEIPIYQFYDFYKIASNDLQEIQSNLKNLEQELKGFSKNLDNQQRYRKKLVEFYIQKNCLAQKEVENFICYKLINHTNKNIRQLPILKSITIRPLGNIFSGSLPYSYSSSKNDYSGILGQSFDINHVNELVNKFNFLPVSAYLNITNTFNNSKKDFYEIVEYFLLEHNDSENLYVKINILSSLREWIEQSHILSKRKDIIFKIIKNFEDKDYLTTCYILPLQIEGIFHDICTLFGVSESELSISSLNKKLDILNKRSRFLHSYEYFSFLFPPIRNAIAHGEVLEVDLKNTAMMLYLDLYSVCELALAEEIPLNAKIKLIKQFDEKNIENNLIGFAVKYIDLKDIEVPNFYNLDEIIAKIENYFNSNNFWNLAKTTLLKMSIDQLSESKEFKILGIIKSNYAESKGQEFFKNELPKIRAELNQKEQMRLANRDKFLNAIKKVT